MERLTASIAKGTSENMTILIVVIVLLLLFGGGGYGYRRWSR
jgi:LPXTG-motif cell wall-anchored protein